MNNDEKMWEVIRFTDKTWGIRQIRTGMVAGKDGKPISHKKKATTQLLCDSMNKAVKAYRDKLKEESS